MKHPSNTMALYHLEGMLDELFTELCRHPSFGSFRIYEAELKEWDPERTYYVEILKREMDAANQRKQYRRIIEYLGDLRTYPGGAPGSFPAALNAYGKMRPECSISVP